MACKTIKRDLKGQFSVYQRTREGTCVVGSVHSLDDPELLEWFHSAAGKPCSYVPAYADPTQTVLLKEAVEYAWEEYDHEDRWTWGMQWLFDICGVMWTLDMDVPKMLSYEPSPLGFSLSDNEERSIFLLNQTQQTLETLAYMINSIVDLAHSKGESL